jgi:hypothetical protein
VSTCETCGGEGTVIEFRRFAGEYQAGEPVEVRCPDCGGAGEFDDDTPAPREAYVASPEYLAWIASLEPKKRPDGRWDIAA